MPFLQNSPACFALATLLPLVSLTLACGDDSGQADGAGDTGTGESGETTLGESGSSDSSTTSSSDTVDSTSTDSSTADSTDTTSTDTTSTDTGEFGCRGECGTPGCGDCPDSTNVAVPGGFSIGATEVRNADYAEFLTAMFTPESLAAWLPTACAWKTDFTPLEWSDSLPDALPVVQVDWCDAWAYCAWSGQQLCGQIGGGPIDAADSDNPAKSQWNKACSQGGIALYPYGIGYESVACNGVDAGFADLVEVGSLAGCEGGYPGVFDMSGNVWEWEDSCVDDPMLTADLQLCQHRGGSYFSTDNNLLCTTDLDRPRNHRSHHVGIRCCDTP